LCFLVKDTYCKYTNFAFICTLFTGLHTMKKVIVIIAGILLITSMFGQTVPQAVYDHKDRNWPAAAQTGSATAAQGGCFSMITSGRSSETMPT
jgi:TRAP-type uncharacterized transport system fused permease subunit